MGLKDEVAKESKGSARNIVDTILEDLPEDESKELLELILDDKIPYPAIGRVLRRRGYELGDESVRRYRKKLQEANI